MEDTQQEVESFVSRETRESSATFVGQWRTLVSTTNWQKGEIICSWRKALIEQGALAREYSDEAWSELAGDVSPQHVGRLRRVHERFHDAWRSYEGLYWTHFLVACEWPDAEMWLEGALQNDWSVAQMRRQRAETLGSLPAGADDNPQIMAADGISEELLEGDVPSDVVVEHLATISTGADSANRATSQGTTPRPREARRLDEVDRLLHFEPLSSLDEPPTLAELPADFSKSLDHFSAVLCKHKQIGWVQLSRDVVLATLESLRMLVLDEH